MQNDHPSDPFASQQPTKRRKTTYPTLCASSTDDSLCCSAYPHDNGHANDSIDDDQDLCFHFDHFRKSGGPYPCLYRTCSNLEFAVWADWKRHWKDHHRQYYLDSNQHIKISELNVSHPTMQAATFRHLQLLTTMGSRDGTDPSSHCIVSFDLSHPIPHSEPYDEHRTPSRFSISSHRQQGRLLWDPLQYNERHVTPRSGRTLSHCSPAIWDRIRSAFHCGHRVPSFWNDRVLFRCGGYYSSNQSQSGHYNEMENNSLSAHCDAFDIDRNAHYPLPDLPQPLHSSSALYVEPLHCLLNVGGEDSSGSPLDKTSVLALDGSVRSDEELRWNDRCFPKMKTKRSYRPSLGLYDDGRTVLLFVAGGCNNDRYDGIKTVESLRLNPWIDALRHRTVNGQHGVDEDVDLQIAGKWKKQRNLSVARRDASPLLHWKGINAMVCCGGDHGDQDREDEPRGGGAHVSPWHSSEIFDFGKARWCRLPDFPEETSHAQNPFIWIEGGVRDRNYWSGLTETSLFKEYGTFDASTGVLCIMGNGFCSEELGIVSFYDPRTKGWQCGGSTEDKWLRFEENYLGMLEGTEEVRNICGVIKPSHD